MTEEPKTLEDLKNQATGAAEPATAPKGPGGARPGAGRPKGSGGGKKPGAVPVSIRGPSNPPPNPEEVRMHATMAVSLLISIPITAMKLEPYTDAERELMSGATLPVLEKYAGEMLVWMGPELALFGVAMMVLGPKIQKRRQEINEAAEKAKEPQRDNLFNQT